MKKILCIFVVAVCALASANTIHSRIIGGGPSNQTQFPYAVSLQQISQSSQETRGHICGGVLITPQHVLTSATCTYSHPPTGAPVPIVFSEYRIFAGAVSLTNETSPDQSRAILNVTRHPEYLGTPAYINDIAVIELNNPFNNTVASPLPLPAQDFVPTEYTECVVAGWGAYSASGNMSVTQKYIRKYVSNWELCRLQYNLGYGLLNLWPSMICASPIDNYSVGTTGDYGNGIVCNGGLTGVLISTTGEPSSSLPEVYTRVSNYTTWIRSVTGGASTFQPGLAVLMMFTVVQLITAKIIS